MGIVSYLICSLGDWSTSGHDIEKVVLLAAGIVLGLLAYLGSSYWMRNEELIFLWKMVTSPPSPLPRGEGGVRGRMSMGKTADVIIIGGGIIGVSIAYHLAVRRAGKIVLLERGLLGEGSTSRCVGGVRLQFSTEINIRFSLESMKTFEHFKEEFGVDPEFKRIGYLFLATTGQESEIFKRNVELQRGFGIPVEFLTPDEIGRRWPYLKTDDLFGGTFGPRDGYAGPNEVLSGFARGARRLGVEIRERTEALGILLSRDKVMGVRTGEGEIDSPVVVNAAGPYASTIGEMAGVQIPVKPIRRQVFVTAPFQLSDRLHPVDH